MSVAMSDKRILGIIAGVIIAMMPVFTGAQTAAQDQLRATIKAEIMADPRSKNLSQAQIESLVQVLAAQAQKQGVTVSQLVYRPTAPNMQDIPAAPTPTVCNDFACALTHAYGLDGSAPWLVGGLFVTTALAIFAFSRLREMGHPHAQFAESTPIAENTPDTENNH